MNLNILFERIKSKQKTLLMFDYDGTLTAIRSTPDEAVLNPAVRNALENIAKSEFLSVAIITGRKIEVLKSLSGLNTDNILISGLHGGEIEINNKIIGGVCNKNHLKIIEKFYNNLKNKCENLKGIIIENKKFSVAMHYRNADEKTFIKAKKIFDEEIINNKINNNFKILAGKKVFELLPEEFTKDKAVYNIINRFKEFLPFYFGDDITDIAAFEEVKKLGGYAVGITPHPFTSKNLLDFEITQQELENFIIKINRTYSI